MLILGLTWQAWFTIVVVMAMFASKIFTKIRTEIAFLAAIFDYAKVGIPMNFIAANVFITTIVFPL